jgi:hypothetical protein
VSPETTLHGLAARFAGTGAEGYLRQLAAHRYGTTALLPDRAQRAGLRRALAGGGGPLARIRGLWAVPPAPPSLDGLRRRRPQSR